jgi:hypothetical protein
MHEIMETAKNEGAADRIIVVEPWGMPLQIPPGHTFRIIARAPTPGQLEIVQAAEAIIVYAWPGSTVDVVDGELLVHRFATPVPAVPPGQSVKEFLDLLLGPPPHAGDRH